MDLRLRGNWKVLPLIVEVGSDVEQETVSLAGLHLPHQSHCCSLIVSIDKLLFFQEVSSRKPAGAAEDERPGTPDTGQEAHPPAITAATSVGSKTVKH